MTNQRKRPCLCSCGRTWWPCVYRYMYVCGDHRSTLMLLHNFSSCLMLQCLTDLTLQIGQAGYSRGLPDSASSVARSQALDAMPGFSCGSWGQKLGPQACKPSTLLSHFLRLSSYQDNFLSVHSTQKISNPSSVPVGHSLYADISTSSMTQSELGRAKLLCVVAKHLALKKCSLDFLKLCLSTEGVTHQCGLKLCPLKENSTHISLFITLFYSSIDSGFSFWCFSCHMQFAHILDFFASQDKLDCQGSCRRNDRQLQNSWNAAHGCHSHMGGPQCAVALRTVCPEDFMFLWSSALSCCPHLPLNL